MDRTTDPTTASGMAERSQARPGTGSDAGAARPSHPVVPHAAAGTSGPLGATGSNAVQSAITRRAVLVGLGAALALPALPRPALARRLVGREPFTIGVLTPGVLPEHAREAAASAMERAVARPVRLRRFGGAARLVDAAAGARLDLAVHTALSYASTTGLCGGCSTPLLRPVAADGTVGLRAVLIVRGGGPEALSDLPGRGPDAAEADPDAVILGAAPGTVTGEVVRRGVAADAGRALAFAGESPDVALSRFMGGGGVALAGHERVDVGGDTLGGTLERLGPGHRVLWRSRPVWHGPLALAARSAALADAVTGALLSLAPGSAALAGLGLGRVRGFAAAAPRDYAPLVALLRP